MQETKQEIIEYIKHNAEFAATGNRMISSWGTSESGETIKDISHELH
jgi:hypothetical protein